LVDEKCSLCKENGEFVQLTKPVDPRPVFKKDLKLLQETISKEFGKEAFNLLLGKSEVIVFNRLPYLDKAYEVLVDGRVLGHLFFDFPSLEWTFKPLQEACNRLWNEKLGSWVLVDSDNVEKEQILTSIDFLDKNLENSCYVIIVSKEQKVVGVGRRINDERMVVVKTWKPRKPRYFDVKASWEKTVEANFGRLRMNVSKACKLIHGLASRLGNRMFVSYSGGKDSLATLLLTLKVLDKVEILFNDTGLEMPETLENVKEVASRLGVEILRVDADEVFWEKVKVLGVPTRENRWCCKVCKLEPMAKFLREKFSGRVLSLVGQRKPESFRRANSRDVWINRFLPDVVTCSPINRWNMLEVWLYLMMEKFDGIVNRLYFDGFERVGCFMCPSSSLADLLTVKRKHRRLWGRWENELKRWILSQNLPGCWIDFGLWRWKYPPKRIINSLKTMKCFG